MYIVSKSEPIGWFGPMICEWQMLKMVC